MSSTLYIDPLLLPSAPSAKSWLAAAKTFTPQCQLKIFASDVSWEDITSQMHLGSPELIRLPAAISLSQTILDSTATDTVSSKPKMAS